MSGSAASFSAKVKAGRNTYFIDVKETKKGDKYLAITENQYNGEENKKTTIRVFGEAIGKFKEAINEAVESISES